MYRLVNFLIKRKRKILLIPKRLLSRTNLDMIFRCTNLETIGETQPLPRFYFRPIKDVAGRIEQRARFHPLADHYALSPPPPGGERN